LAKFFGGLLILRAVREYPHSPTQAAIGPTQIITTAGGAVLDEEEGLPVRGSGIKWVISIWLIAHGN
jgi:hypothetical protein